MAAIWGRRRGAGRFNGMGRHIRLSAEEKFRIVGAPRRVEWRGPAQAPPVPEHGRRESKADAEFLELDGDLPRRSRLDRKRKFAAGEEAGGIARQGNEIRLGEPPRQALVLKRADRNIDGVGARSDRGADG